MAHEQQIINVSTNPAMKELVAEVVRTRQPKVLRDDETGAEVFVHPTSTKHSVSKARPVTREDALFRLVAIGKSETPTNDAEHKHEALEEAHRRLHT